MYYCQVIYLAKGTHLDAVAGLKFLPVGVASGLTGGNELSGPRIVQKVSETKLKKAEISDQFRRPDWLARGVAIDTRRAISITAKPTF